MASEGSVLPILLVQIYVGLSLGRNWDLHQASSILHFQKLAKLKKPIFSMKLTAVFRKKLLT